MKISASTSGSGIPMMTGLVTGTIVLGTAVLCPPLVPLAWLSAIFVHPIVKDTIKNEIDEVAVKSANRVAENWKRKRKPGEKGVNVTHTLYSGGALFNLPMKRTYHFELDNDD